MVLQWGAGVVIARYYGAKNSDNLHKAIHTTVAFGFVAGSVLTVVGMYFAPKILVLMGTRQRCFLSQWHIFARILQAPLELLCTIFL